MRDEWEKRLADSGYRITAPRRAVIGVLVEASTPLSPKEILELARSDYPGTGLVTVYRTLTILSDLGLVRRAHREDRCHGYLRASPGHNHAVICERCGAAIEFRGQDDLAALIQRVETGTGFHVESHLLQLFGLCPICQKRYTNPAGKDSCEKTV